MAASNRLDYDLIYAIRVCHNCIFIVFAVCQVAEEVRSVVKLLLPLTDLEAAEVNQPSQANTLDTALLQLKKVARSLALNNNSQVSFSHAHQLICGTPLF